jgi:3',5'-cyclic AMP phosphodiesterase CpdA
MMLIAHITDFHVRGPGELMGDRIPTDARLRAVVHTLNQMDPQPDLVVGTGDLVNDGDRVGGAVDQYRNLAAILADLRAPALMIPGNHDDRQQMRVHLADYLPRDMTDPDLASDRPLTFEVTVSSLRILALDTVVPGEHHGLIGTDQLNWLADRLRAEPDQPTLIIQHHPPFDSGITYMDEMGLRDAAQLEQTLRGHPQVVGVLCGHLHRSITSRFADTMAITAPSTGAQLALRLNGERFRYSSEAPAFAVHLWNSSDPYRLRSHTVAVDEGEVWMPDWAQALEQA